MNSFTPLLTSLAIRRYRLRYKAVGAGRLPVHKISAIRGALGWAIRSVKCTKPTEADWCGESCSCPFKTLYHAPIDSQYPAAHLYQSGAPVPYSIWCNDTEEKFLPNDMLVFQINWFGNGHELMATLLFEVWQALGAHGLGEDRLRFRLDAVEEIKPFPLAILAADNALTQRLAVEFMSPMSFQETHPSRPKTKRPLPTVPFDELVRRLAERMAVLTWHYTDTKIALPETDSRERYKIYQNWLNDYCQAAADVQIVAQNLRYERIFRKASDKKAYPMEGWTGRIEYSNGWQQYALLLALGQYVGVGNDTVFGLGQYRLQNFD
jgi:CRISPR-associated endoribonuclease Cas6